MAWLKKISAITANKTVEPYIYTQYLNVGAFKKHTVKTSV